jgi:hypothetical protein
MQSLPPIRETGVVKLAFLKMTVEESRSFIPPEDSLIMRLSLVEFNELGTILGELDTAGRIYLCGSRADEQTASHLPI